MAGFLALWFSVPVSIILVGGLPIADDLRAFLLPLILFYLVWPPIGLVSLICAILFDKMGLATVPSSVSGSRISCLGHCGRVEVRLNGSVISRERSPSL